MSDKKHLARLASGYVRDDRHQTVQMPGEMVDEITTQAERLDRSRSWMVQFAWKIARRQIKQNPGPL